MYTRMISAIFAAGAVFFGGLLLSLAFIAALAIPFEWLWNRTMVSLAHAPAVDYWQSAGVLYLWYLVNLARKGMRISAKMRGAQ